MSDNFHDDATTLFQKNVNDMTEQEINTFLKKHKQFMINQKCDPYDGGENKDDQSNLSHTKIGKLVCIQRCFAQSLFYRRLLPAITTTVVKPVMTQQDFQTLLVDALPEFIEEQRKKYKMTLPSKTIVDDVDKDSEKKPEPKEKQTKKKQKK